MQDAKASTKAKYKDKNILDSSLFTVKFILMFTVSFIAYDSVLLIVIVIIWPYHNVSFYFLLDLLGDPN
jgi:hypothetical protein